MDLGGTSRTLVVCEPRDALKPPFSIGVGGCEGTTRSWRAMRMKAAKVGCVCDMPALTCIKMSRTGTSELAAGDNRCRVINAHHNALHIHTIHCTAGCPGLTALSSVGPFFVLIKYFLNLKTAKINTSSPRWITSKYLKVVFSLLLNGQL